MFKDQITDDQILQECMTFRQALRMSWRKSGKGLDEIALSMLGGKADLQDLSNMVKNLSRIINPRTPQDKRNLDGDHLIPFMIATGNSIPLRWLCLKYSPQIVAAKIVSHADILEKIEGLEGMFVRAMSNIHQASRRIRSKGLIQAGVRLSVTAPADSYAAAVPSWLQDDAEVMLKECVNG